MILDFYRYLTSKLFGFRWVVLIDFDGKRHIRLAKIQDYNWVANRLRLRRVTLLDNGEIRDHGGYVARWKPHVPFTRHENHRFLLMIPKRIVDKDEITVYDRDTIEKRTNGLSRRTYVETHSYYR